MRILRFSTRAAKALSDLPEPQRRDILEAIEGLASEPRPHGCKKLSGKLQGSYRIRIGSYRVIYDVYDGEKSVLIAAIGLRKSIYR